MVNYTCSDGVVFRQFWAENWLLLRSRRLQVWLPCHIPTTDLCQYFLPSLNFLPPNNLFYGCENLGHFPPPLTPGHRSSTTTCTRDAPTRVSQLPGAKRLPAPHQRKFSSDRLCPRNPQDVIK